MRQILYGEQWIHPEAPPQVQEIFHRKGKLVKIKKGQELSHGGPDGEISLLTKGLCLYQFYDWSDKEHIMAVILPNRTIGDIDAACKNVANVNAYVARDGEALVLPYKVWHEEITKDTKVLEAFTVNVIQKQESAIEALLACFTMEIDMRLRSLLHAVTKAYYPIKDNAWNPVPIPLNTVVLARIISSSRTSVSLTLNEWIQKGLAAKDGKILLIHGSLYQELFDWWESKAEVRKPAAGTRLL